MIENDSGSLDWFIKASVFSLLFFLPDPSSVAEQRFEQLKVQFRQVWCSQNSFSRTNYVKQLESEVLDTLVTDHKMTNGHSVSFRSPFHYSINLQTFSMALAPFFLFSFSWHSLPLSSSSSSSYLLLTPFLQSATAQVLTIRGHL